MNQNYAALIPHFEQHQLHFDAHPEDHVITSGFKLQNTSIHLLAHADPEVARIVYTCAYPTPLPPERRAAVGEFFHRVNPNQQAGNFELDYDDGEARFALGLLWNPTAPPPTTSSGTPSSVSPPWPRATSPPS